MHTSGSERDLEEANQLLLLQGRLCVIIPRHFKFVLHGKSIGLSSCSHFAWWRRVADHFLQVFRFGSFRGLADYAQQTRE